MTKIEFHSGATDKLDYTCRLLRKACSSGKTVVVTGEPEPLAALDRLLWRFSASSFVAHCGSSALPSTLAASPVVLSASLDGSLADKDVLVNIGQSLPPGFERFPRLIEVISSQPQDVLAGRIRWKDYRDRGYELKQKSVVDVPGTT